MKIVSKFAVGYSSINSPLAYIWKLCRLYVLRPEVLFCGVILLCLLLYLQAIDTWSRGLLGRLQATLSGRQKLNRVRSMDATGQNDHKYWQELKTQSSAYAIVGRRPRMEDRFIIEENINNNTGISFFAVFDGHGGEFAADYAKDILVKNIYDKLIETTKLLKVQKLQRSALPKSNHATSDIDNQSEEDISAYIKRKTSRINTNIENSNKENDPSAISIRRVNTLRKSNSVTSECFPTSLSIDKFHVQKETSDAFAQQLNVFLKTFSGKDNLLFKSNNSKNNNNNNNNSSSKANSKAKVQPQQLDAKCYIENSKINFSKLITDEVLAADYKLVETAKRTTNIAGTTALIAVIHDSRLIVANVGDSRGVMYNSRGISIPLSFDHKPQQVRELKRIQDAGGFIAFRGVWRVAGILATSRALGDYPLKDKNLVIANPDVLTFDLNDHKPSFIILASDGLWDTFSNEEACNFIKEHLNESDFGARSLALQSYNRGSVDNITVLVIVFKNGIYRISSANEGKHFISLNTKDIKSTPAGVVSAINLNRLNSIRVK